jgi:S1-C subfamily serine protease
VPRHHLGGAGAPAAAVKTAAAELPTPEEPLPAEAARTTPTMAQAAFQPFHVRTGVGGGVQLYPEMRIQRQFGLHDGDVVTAVNGIAVAGSEALQEALRSAADTLSLTVVHNGVSQTVSVPVDE